MGYSVGYSFIQEAQNGLYFIQGHNVGHICILGHIAEHTFILESQCGHCSNLGTFPLFVLEALCRHYFLFMVDSVLHVASSCQEPALAHYHGTRCTWLCGSLRQDSTVCLFRRPYIASSILLCPPSVHAGPCIFKGPVCASTFFPRPCLLTRTYLKGHFWFHCCLS